jgi:hypothetical protein
MLTEDDIADLFEQVVHDLDPDVDVIVGKAEQMGRRLRTRRRVYLVAGNSLLVAAMAGVGLTAGVWQLRPHAVPVSAGARASAGTPSASTASGHGSDGKNSQSPVRQQPTAMPITKSSPGQGASPGGGMSRHEMLTALRRMMPAHTVVSHVRTDGSKGSLEVDYNDGMGAVDLMIDVSTTASYGAGNPLQCPSPLWTDEGPRPAGALPISCAMRTLPDGSIERDAVMYADVKGFYGYGIYDQRPDGITVFIQVGNGIIHTLPQVDRARPPGSMAEWTAVAENPAWHL